MQPRLVIRLITCVAFAAMLGSAQAGKSKPGNVPPGMEIEVLDPNVDPTGKPAVMLKDECGVLKVDIPPTVLVHRYYYTGDRSFQAQLLPGGPSVVVVNHPKTGERCYIEVQMPPGAPRVTYGAHSIEYDFGQRGMKITFLPFFQPKVTYRNGTTVPRAAAKTTAAVGRGASTVVHATGIPEHTKEAVCGTKNAVCTVTQGIGDVATQLTMPIKNLVKATPLGSALEGDPAANAARVRDRAVQRASAESVRAEADFSTLR